MPIEASAPLATTATMNKEIGRSAAEFTRNLHDIQAQIEDEARAYNEMPQEGKRKCLDTLEETMRKIKKDLTVAEHYMPDTNEVQIILKSGKSKIADFTKEEIMAEFHAENHRNRGTSCIIPIPSILTVTLEDNFQPDANGYFRPIRMCFVRFSCEEEVRMVLGFEVMHISHGITNSVSVGHHIQFIQPLQIPEVRKMFRNIGNLLTRLDTINQELKNIGAIRGQGIPKLGPEFCDRQTYREYLERLKAQRTTGASLDHHSYAPLASMRPVDTTSLNASIKALYDEECDILIQLREFQLSGVEFEFEAHITRQ
jgi:hypothetical protein